MKKRELSELQSYPRRARRRTLRFFGESLGSTSAKEVATVFRTSEAVEFQRETKCEVSYVPPKSMSLGVTV